MKVILDTNLFVAAYFNKASSSAKILKLVEENKLIPYFSKSMFSELEFILKNIRARADFKEKVYDILGKGEMVEGFKIKYVVKDDPDDDKLLAVAEKAKAEYLITSDKHLLQIKKYEGTKIVKPSDFLQRIK